MKPKLNREAVDAIKNFLMSPDGFGCGGAEWEVFSNYLSSLVVENELEEWEKCTCRGLDPMCPCQSEALRNSRKERFTEGK